MFKRYLVACFGPDGLLRAPEDAGGGAGASTARGEAGGSQPHEEGTNDDADAGESHADATPAESDDDDILVADEDYSDTPFHQHPRFKAVTAKLKKLARQNSRLRSTADRYKGVDLDTLRTRASVTEQLEGLFARNPKLHKQVLDAMSSGNQPASGDEADFDPKSLPFDVNDDVGKYFVEQDRTIRRLAKQLEGLNNTNNSTAKANYEMSWKQATDAASIELPDHVKDVFQDAMYGAYRVSMADGKKVNPQVFVRQYLDKLKTRGVITGKAATRAAGASAQRIAENNKQLPRQPAGGGQPASSRKVENVSDVNKRLKQMWRSA